MSGHHDDHHSTEQKPVSFTVPFILACVTLVIVIAFLSLCNPQKHHDSHNGGESHGTTMSEGSTSPAAESTKPEAEAEAKH